MVEQQQTEPWFKQFWVWIIIAIPLTSIIGGIIMINVAVNGSSDIVVDNYYKKGKAINLVFDQDAMARELDLSARLDFDFAGGELRIQMTNPVVDNLSHLELELMHPLEAKKDIRLTLKKTSAGEYRISMPGLLKNRYHLSLHPAAPSPWRLTGDINFDHSGQVVLSAR